MMNLVQGNFIGTDNTGKAKLGNTLVGVVLASKASNNTIGGAAAPPAGLGNVISGNGSDGSASPITSPTGTTSRAISSA